MGPVMCVQCLFDRSNLYRGGKVAMALALSPDLPPEVLSHLIVADIAPSKGALSQEFRNYTDAMQRIEQSQVTTRKAANDIIHEVESVGPSITEQLQSNLSSDIKGSFYSRLPTHKSHFRSRRSTP